MKTLEVPKSPERLLAFAESIATDLSERHQEFAIAAELEALLRASIAAATSAIDRYVAILAAGHSWPEALSCIKEAKRERDRSLERLRRRLNRSITQARRYISD